MAKHNNFGDWATGIADAIRYKRGKGETINGQDFEDEIYAIEPLLDTINITSNGKVDVKNYRNAFVNVATDADLIIKGLSEKNIEKIDLPYGTTKIGNYAFYMCSNLNSITIPDTVTFVSDNAFSSCSSLQEITIPDSVTGIGSNAFKYCSKLKNVQLSNQISTLYGGCFENCTELQEITIPDSVTILFEAIFKGCSKLSKINFSKNLSQIGNSCFESCISLEEITIPDSVTLVGSYCFQKCSNLKRVKLSNNLSNTSSSNLSYAFMDCKSLEFIEIPEGVKRLGGSFVAGCTALQEITIPSSVTYIGYNALKFASSSKKGIIVMKSLTPPQVENSAVDLNLTEKIFVEVGTRNSFISATNWSQWADIIVEKNNVIVNVPSGLLNNENYLYSIDNGVTYNQFTTTTLPLENVATIKMKSTTADTTILIGTTEGGNDVGTIANSELTFSFDGDTIIYLTIQ